MPRSSSPRPAPRRNTAPRLPSREHTAAAIAKTVGRSPAFAAWMEDVARVAVPGGLTAEEEEIVGRQILAGSVRAVVFLVEENLPLALSAAAIYAEAGLPYEDVVAVANEALWKAARTYDYRIGRFSTHGAWICWRACRLAALNQGRAIRLPIYIQEAASKLRQVRKLAETAGEELSIEQLAERAGVPLVHALAASDAVGTVPIAVLDAAGEEDDASFADAVDSEGARPGDNFQASGPEQAGETAALLAQLQEAIPRAGLTADEVAVLRHTFGLERAEVLGINKISRRIGRSRDDVRRLRVTALNKLRLVMGAPAQPLPHYLTPPPAGRKPGPASGRLRAAAG